MSDKWFYESQKTSQALRNTGELMFRLDEWLRKLDGLSEAEITYLTCTFNHLLLIVPTLTLIEVITTKRVLRLTVDNCILDPENFRVTYFDGEWGPEIGKIAVIVWWGEHVRALPGPYCNTKAEALIGFRKMVEEELVKYRVCEQRDLEKWWREAQEI